MKTSIFAFLFYVLALDSVLAASCGNIQNRDRREFCEARKKGTTARCGNISNRDFKEYCYAVIGGRKARCGNIQNRDFRNECRAMF